MQMTVEYCLPLPAAAKEEILADHKAALRARASMQRARPVLLQQLPNAHKPEVRMPQASASYCPCL